MADGAWSATQAQQPPARRDLAAGVMSWRGALWLVGLPCLLAGLYLFLFATPMYVSEARFVVRSARPAQGEGLSSVLQGVGLAPGETEAFAAHEYIMSRDAIGDLLRRHDLRRILARPGADLLARFPRPWERNDVESLYRAFPRYVDVRYDSTTGISTLKVKGFRPEDAQRVAGALLTGGEALVNQMNRRAEAGAVREAEITVGEAQARVVAAQRALTAFRTRERLLDPARTSAASLDLIAKLALETAALRAERVALSRLAPASPQLPGLDSRITGYERQIEKERARVVGESDSLAPKIGEFERLQMEREFADRALAAANVALETARLVARRKRLYLQTIVAPNRPDAPLLPRRVQSFALVLVSALLAYGALVLVLAGLREHRQR